MNRRTASDAPTADRPDAAAARALVAGRRAWIISDGKAGNDAQTKGVAEALGLAYDVKRIDPAPPWSWLAPWGPVGPSERFGSPRGKFHAPWPEFAFSIGRLTTPYLRALKRHAGPATFTVILQNPKVPLSTADAFWVPDHDRLRGANVITTLTAPHSFSPARLAKLRAAVPPVIAALPKPRVAVALGGPNGDYTYGPAAMAHLASALQSLGALGAGLMLTASRRTPAGITTVVQDAVREIPHVFWNGEGHNPYADFLAHADAFIVPGNSVNMTGEPCVTGKPVYVFEPDGGSAKFTRYHQALRELGATRPLPARFDRLETWTYPPLNSAETIADEIAVRWGAARLLRPSGADAGTSEMPANLPFRANARQ